MLTCGLVALDVGCGNGHPDLDLDARTVPFLALFEPDVVGAYPVLGQSFCPYWPLRRRRRGNGPRHTKSQDQCENV